MKAAEGQDTQVSGDAMKGFTEGEGQGSIREHLRRVRVRSLYFILKAVESLWSILSRESELDQLCIFTSGVVYI